MAWPHREIYFKGHTANGNDIHATFTPDAKYVLSGSEDGKLHAWEVLTCVSPASVTPVKSGTSACVTLSL